MKAKRKKCDICKELFMPANSFQQVCFKPCCAIEWAKDHSKVSLQRKRLKQAQNASDRAALREFKAKDVQYQHNLTQPKFNRMRVLQELKWFEERGLEPECISCGKTKRTWSCGHLKTVGAQGGIRYSELNTFLQCWYACNKHLSGNLNGTKTTRGLLQGLKDRFGEEHAQQIIDYCDSQTAPRKYTGYELQDMRAKYSKAIRQLEQVE